jgi:D-alanine-D-alanine ligase
MQTTKVLKTFVVSPTRQLNLDRTLVYSAGQTLGPTKPEFKPRIDESLSNRLAVSAMKLHKAMGLAAYSRIDFRVRDDEIFALDVNSMPNLSGTSFLPNACRAAGISLPDFISRVLRYTWMEWIKTA